MGTTAWPLLGVAMDGGGQTFGLGLNRGGRVRGGNGGGVGDCPRGSGGERGLRV